MSFSARDPETQRRLIGRCIEIASVAPTSGDVPVGAMVLSPAGEPIATGFNTRERDADPLGHAELNALRSAAAILNSWRLDGCTLAVTLEPCAMCAGAISQSRVSSVIFGAWDEKAGAAGSVFDVLREPRLNHFVETHPGVLVEQCSAQLSGFFESLRQP